MGITGIILAGGKSRRMGLDKSVLKINNQNLVENLYKTTGELFDEILIAGNSESKFALPYAKEIYDICPGFGPLSGIHAGLSHAKNEICFVMACDMPFVSEDVIKTILAYSNDNDAVIPRINQHIQVLFGMYKKSCVSAIEEMFKNHNATGCDLYLNVKTKYLSEDDFAGLDIDKTFFNINTPQDYMAALGIIKTTRQSITKEDAQEFLLAKTMPVAANQVDFKNAFCHILAEDIIAPSNYPLNPVSSMDGYAVNSTYVNNALVNGELVLPVKGTVNAGQEERITIITEKETVAVMTGAIVPIGADAVIPQENVAVMPNKIIIKDEINRRKFIIPAGNEFKKDEVLAEKGNLLLPELAALLNMANLQKVKIYGPVSIGIICIGDELVKRQNAYDNEKIPNSNGILLEALCNEQEAIAYDTVVVGDDAQAVADAVERTIAKADLVITTGGTGNGGHDVISEAFALLGCDLLFNKIQIRPGASIWAWQKRGKTVLCLPGTPGAVLVDFFLFAAPVIRKLQGQKQCLPQEIELPMFADYTKRHGMREMRNGRLVYKEGRLWAKEERSQSCSMFGLKGSGNLLIDIPSGHESLKKGDLVKAYIVRKLGDFNE